MRYALGLVLPLLAICFVPVTAGAISLDDSLASMEQASLTPWIDPPGASQQAFPFFLGATARQVALGLPGKALPEIPIALKEKGENAARRLLDSLGVERAEFELWPAEDFWGQTAWVFARWRASESAAWQWLSAPRNWHNADKPIFAEKLDPFKAKDQSKLFDDFLAYDDPYSQPEQGDCVWVAPDGHIAAAWLAPRDRELNRARFTREPHHLAYCLPQPARLGSERIAFVLKAGHETHWDSRIVWVDVPPKTLKPMAEPARVTRWPADFQKAYKQDVEVFAGDKSSFKIKGSFQEGNDLEALVDFLEARYRKLGIETERQRFTWRGIPQSNLIAKIPGWQGGPPVLAADHIDTAVEEDTFSRTGERVTTHGANDNVTATATLLRAAEVLKDSKPRYDIWLVHFTGEEFPSDGLGCWHFLSEMLKAKHDIRAALIMDFIGYHRPGENMFQINPNGVDGSLDLARVALDAAAVSPSVKAIYRPRNSRWNGVYNTDVQEFEYLGIPALLFNEYMNYSQGREKFDPYNHQSTDTADHIKWDYASAIAKVAIETLARLAETSR